MFHKEASIQGRKKAVDVPLRKSDRRHLRQRVGTFFEPEDGDTMKLKELLDETFLQGNLSARTLPMPSKAWNMILYLKPPSSKNSNNNNNKDSQQNHLWPYQTSSQFVWMALEEKNKVVHETPTVALWAVLIQHIADLSPYAVLVPSAVSKFVCRGADVMRAGMRTLPSPSRKMVAIVAGGNPQPFAVGLVNPKNHPDNGAQEFGVNTKGIGVEIWNAYGDDLWRFSNTQEQTMGKDSKNELGGGAPFDNGHYGNVGFMDGKYKYVLPLQGQEESDEEDDSDEEYEIVEHEDTSDSDPKTAWGEPGNNTASEENTTEVNQNDDDDDVQEATEGVDNLKVSETDAAPASPDEPLPEEEEEEAVEPLTPDDILHQAVCQALVGLSNKDLPVLIATFYSKHVLPNRLPGSTIDLKATTYKKFGAYIKAQVNQGLLQVGPDRNNPKNTDPMALLTGYYKKHEDLQGISKSNSATISSSLDPSTKSKLLLVNLYLIPAHWPKLLRLDDDDVKAANATSEDRKGTGMLTIPEVRKILEGYMAREQLIPPSRPDQVQLDGPLTDALYKKEATSPQYVLRKDLAKLFTKKLNPAYALVQMPGSKITKLAKGSPPKVELQVSMRASRKFVTRVRGLEDYGIDPHYFSKDVAKRLACASTIETDPVGRAALRKHHVEVTFQGNIVDELEALLVDESMSAHGGVKGADYSVPQQAVAITLRKGVLRKKGGSKK
jgi:translation initiation factor 2D